MSFAEQYNIYIEELKLKGINLSKTSYFRKNYNEVMQFIADHKNQGQGSSYDMISKFAFNDGIKTKLGKPLSRAHINEILISIKKEKGLKLKKSSPKKKISIKKVDEIKPSIQSQKPVEKINTNLTTQPSFNQFPDFEKDTTELKPWQIQMKERTEKQELQLKEIREKREKRENATKEMRENSDHLRNLLKNM